MDKKENLTRSYIFGAFLKLLEHNNYDKISVCNICEKAGVSRMSFYRNFTSKEDLTIKGIDVITTNLKEHLDSLEFVNEYVVTKTFFEVTKKYQKALLSFVNTSMGKMLKDTVLSKVTQNVPMDYFNKTTKYIPVFFFGSVTTVLFEWLKTGAVETPDEMARLICSLINFDKIEKPDKPNHGSLN